MRARLLVDCMGHWSPIVKQIRGTQRPDGMCLVVGGCASGFTPETNKCAGRRIRAPQESICASRSVKICWLRRCLFGRQASAWKSCAAHAA